jgi:hypothetical protein
VKRAAAAWLPPLLWCAVVFAGSSVSTSTGRRLFPGADRVAHVVEYGILGLLLARALLYTGAWLPVRQPDRSPEDFARAARRRAFLLAALLGTVYGATDEFHQSFVPHREPEWGDLAADAVGSLLGAGAWVGLRRGRAAPVPATASAPGPARRP